MMDEHLKGAERALRRTKAIRLLEDALAGSSWELGRIDRCEAVKHRPGRRLVIRYAVEMRRDGERWRRMTVFGKLFRGRRGERIARQLAWLAGAADDDLIVPTPLGYSARWRLLLLAEIDGTSLARLLRRPDAPEHLARAMAGLASLHALDPHHPEPAQTIDWHRHDAAAESRVLAVAVERVAAAPPAVVPAGDYRGRVEETVRHLLDAGDSRPACPIHRDLHPDQMLLSRGRLALLDLDELALGEPELDLGNLLAHLVLADLQEHGAVRTAPFLARHAVDAYGRYAAVRTPDHDRIRVYQAASLLRLASLERLAHPARSRLDWTSLAHRLLEAAGAVLGGR